MNAATLVIIYNHHYPKNIERLDLIYKDKFKSIFHLIPFYNGEKSNVIPVYGNSFYFQAYIAQAFASLSKESSDHFIFIADDMILNPKIDEESYKDIFNIDLDDNFIPYFDLLSEKKTFWHRVPEALTWQIKKPGLEITSLLPTKREAEEIFRNFGWTNLFATPVGAFERGFSYLPILKSKPLNLKKTVKTLYKLIRTNFRIMKKNYRLGRRIRSRWNFKFSKGEILLEYPLVGAYSDLLVINKHSFPQFAHYCGLFAASELFVELAIPTALVFSSKNIVTESDNTRSGRAYWGDEVKELGIFDFKLNNLLENFPDEKLYIHPIKLSEWK
jgi:hypothetical protein